MPPPRSCADANRASSDRLVAISALPAVAPKRREQQADDEDRPGHRSTSTDADGSSRRTVSAPDPAPGHLVHRELVAVQRHLLALPRHPAEFRQHQAAHRAHVLARELVAQPSLELGERHAAQHPPVALVELQYRRHLVGVVLVLDLAHDLLQDVLQRHDAGRAAELVHHHGEVARPPLEVAQLAVERLALGHERRRPDQRGPLPRRRMAVQRVQHVLGVEDAGDVVGMSVVDEEPGVLRAPQQCRAPGPAPSTHPPR